MAVNDNVTNNRGFRQINPRTPREPNRRPRVSAAELRRARMERWNGPLNREAGLIRLNHGYETDRSSSRIMYS